MLVIINDFLGMI